MTAPKSTKAKGASKRTGTSKRRFSTVATTQATAETPAPATPKPEPEPAAAAPTPAKRSAFTWRLDPHQALQLDTLVLELRTELARGHLSRSDVLGALVQIAAADKALRAQLVERLAAG